jgi:polysaccharide export outer membrane protein
MQKFALALGIVIAPATFAQTTPVPPPGQMPAAATTPTAMPAVRDSYVLGRGDTIEISVLGRSDYTMRATIQDDGTILLPFINSVKAADRTILQLRSEIAKALEAGGYFKNPAVNITVVGFQARNVTVLGSVKNPSVIAMDREYRLTEIVARSGGVLAPEIDTITITRADGASQEYSLSAIATSGPAADPVVRDGDKVFVAPAKTFYLYGQVRTPGVYPFVANMTVRMALARGGGLTELGSSKRVKLVRGDKESKVDLSYPIMPGDVIEVGERFF